ncbi:unnamed protein product [Didymodactylos carnosus]|uniref:G-protein coupled receptors family 1 profile domain-containing protein n=1 Tax=Didymodactylos carnosus TaxID=1234261 RepID=A0A815WS48_9BILA|nr:unnamed protein product [Didymodactylos carnosus]CAF1549620.1 unnamed protein product [Didymodactylos carnosus]CAF4067292.1 unnamed protein product [Didymodactylos carnosus]CAF4410557.1 unnamed protein product [Didymodactylos carnosus]
MDADLVIQQMSRYGMISLLLIGDLGTIFNCLIFRQPALKSNPCSMYFLASSVSQLFSFNFGLLTRILSFGFTIDPSNTSLFYCKLRSYLSILVPLFPRFYILLACLDRWANSSSSAHLRKWSSVKIARRMILCNFLFWLLTSVHLLIFNSIVQNKCQNVPGFYPTFYSFYVLIVPGLGPIAGMLILGLLTLKNVKTNRRRIHPLRAGERPRMKQKDLQLCQMLLFQVLINVLLNLPSPLYLIYSTFSTGYKSPQRLAIEKLMSYLVLFLVYLGYTLSFFLYTLSSRTYRHEFVRLFKQLKHTLSRQRPLPPARYQNVHSNVVYTIRTQTTTIRTS